MDKNTNNELSIYEKLAFSVINLYMSLEEKKRLEKETIYSDSALREVISNAVCWKSVYCLLRISLLFFRGYFWGSEQAA